MYYGVGLLILPKFIYKFNRKLIQVSTCFVLFLLEHGKLIVKGKNPLGEYEQVSEGLTLLYIKNYCKVIIIRENWEKQTN